VTLGQRLARFTTDVVVRWPALWRLFRGVLRRLFDRLAPRWDTMRSPGGLAAFEDALGAVAPPPQRVLDLGTGTGSAAFVVARRFPAAEVLGLDFSPRMVDEARRKASAEPAGRVRFEVADAERLPVEDGSFDLVTLANMIPFFDELARVVASGGAVLFSFSLGPRTPIYVPRERLEAELRRRGFVEFAEFSTDSASALLARKR
jgi:ubiquinone/menaquinone biosynthesis C-methylase UbiE